MFDGGSAVSTTIRPAEVTQQSQFPKSLRRSVGGRTYHRTFSRDSHLLSSDEPENLT
jgi:hypothetical protein